MDDAYDIAEIVDLLDLAPSHSRHLATVLVVDDDATLRRLYRTRLAAVGFDVIEAADGRAAIAAAHACRVDAVLLDVMMPDVDGWGVLGTLRDDAHTAEAKIILMSAEHTLLAELERIGIGADAYFVKCGSGRKVADLVDEVLARRFGIIDALPRGAWGALSDVGVQTLIAAACNDGLRGVLTVDDAVTSWSVSFDEGVIAGADAVSSGLILPDRDALLSLIAIKDAPYAFDPVVEPPRRTLGTPWCRIAHELCDELNAQKRSTRAHVLKAAGRLAVDERRLNAWLSSSNGDARDVAQAIAGAAGQGEHRRRDPAESLLEDLWRRGVITSP